MDLETGFAKASPRAAVIDRRVASDRRTYSDRRRSGGLFAVRARRDGAGYDRRQGERREQARRWFSRWLSEG